MNPVPGPVEHGPRQFEVQRIVFNDDDGFAGHYMIPVELCIPSSTILKNIAGPAENKKEPRGGLSRLRSGSGHSQPLIACKLSRTVKECLCCQGCSRAAGQDWKLQSNHTALAAVRNLPFQCKRN